jgi:Saxitoxin biosynthesis operon protein SxtJ
MSFIDLDRAPSARELRVFGLLLPLFFGLVGGLVGWKSGAWRVSTGIWIAGGGVSLAYWGVRTLRWPLYALWMRAAFPMGWAVSNVALAVIFYGVFTPYGFAMRLFGRDKLQLAIDRNAPTYWTPVEPTADKSRYFKQS